MLTYYLPKINNSFLLISTRIHCRVVRRDKEQDDQHLLTGLPPNDTGLQGPGGETLCGHKEVTLINPLLVAVLHIN